MVVYLDAFMGLNFLVRSEERREFPNNWCEQQYLPDDIKNAKYYTFGENKTEQSAKAYWESVKKKKL